MTDPRPIGRPPRPNADDEKRQLCELVSSGWTRSAACEVIGVPFDTVGHWLGNDKEFSLAYARARVEQAHALADHALTVARSPHRDSMAEVQRMRLEVDTIKWLTSKLAPKLYGERLFAEHAHTVGVVLLPPLDPPPASIGLPPAGTVRQLGPGEGE